MDDLASVIRNSTGPAAEYMAKAWTLAELAIRDSATSVAWYVDQLRILHEQMQRIQPGQRLKDTITLLTSFSIADKKRAWHDLQRLNHQAVSGFGQMAADMKRTWDVYMDSLDANNARAMQAFEKINKTGDAAT
ncbi:MAG TPA: hypothetical protein VFL78_11755 [Rhodanobacteraceae bacterium]|nr:hypothetical protein [Rhodanobacteraceae bacterium]